MDRDDTVKSEIVELTTELVAAYVARNALPAADLPGFINLVHNALDQLSVSEREAPAEPVPAERKAAVSIRKSITDEALVCLDCGVRFKTLKRHLTAEHGLDPVGYRARWSLPKDYPMVAPAYSSNRSHLAKTLGLGRKAFGV